MDTDREAKITRHWLRGQLHFDPTLTDLVERPGLTDFDLEDLTGDGFAAGVDDLRRVAVVVILAPDAVPPMTDTAI